MDRVKALTNQKNPDLNPHQISIRIIPATIKISNNWLCVKYIISP